jgi:hypothetical protein
VLFILTCVLAAGTAAANTLASEGFNYTPGLSLNGQNGGSGWSTSWSTPGGLDATIAASSLTFGGLAISNGAVSTAGFQPSNQGSSVATWIRNLTTPVGADNTTVYLSFLFRPDAGFGFYGGLNFGNLFVGRSGNQTDYGLEGPVNDLSLSSTSVVQGQTVFFVLRASFLPGNDILSLYMNPTPGQPEPSTPDAVKTDLDVGTVTGLTINNYGGFTTDEIRIGTTFAEVTPLAPVPEPAFGWTTGLIAAFAALTLRRAAN